MSEIYQTSNAPCTYGNMITIRGSNSGAGQLILGWSGQDNVTENVYYRSHRDTVTGGWGPWVCLSGKASITTTSLGQTWYRKYSDGWIEQGGYVTSGGSTLTAFTFPIAFTTAIRTIHLEPNATGGEYWNAEIRIIESSLTSFSVKSVQAHSVGSWKFDFYWFAAGY